MTSKPFSPTLAARIAAPPADTLQIITRPGVDAAVFIRQWPSGAMMFAYRGRCQKPVWGLPYQDGPGCAYRIEEFFRAVQARENLKNRKP